MNFLESQLILDLSWFSVFKVDNPTILGQTGTASSSKMTCRSSQISLITKTSLCHLCGHAHNKHIRSAKTFGNCALSKRNREAKGRNSHQSLFTTLLVHHKRTSTSASAKGRKAITTMDAFRHRQCFWSLSVFFSPPVSGLSECVQNQL